MATIIRTSEASAAKTTKDGLRLLSLDGGGVRGLSALLILEHLMQGLNPEAPPKPCEVFDLIGGTSTGGLIAIMLGRLRMDVSSCIDTYLELSSSVFKPNRSRLNFLGKLKDTIKVKSKFSSVELEKAIKGIVQSKLGDENVCFREDSDSKCRVFVCAIRKENATLARLRSYKAINDAATVEDCKIWEAGRATSAATSFFDPIVIGKYGESFIDGATGSNNPVFHVFDEAQKIWVDSMNIRCLISIGTGNPSLAAFGRSLREIAKTIVKISTETENTEERFLQANLLQQNKYFRFNVAHGLEKIGFEDHKMKPSITASTTHYLGLGRTREVIATCLDSLASQFANDQLLSSEVEDTDKPSDTTHTFNSLSEDERKCLASFALADYKTYRSRVPKRHPGTLKWFLDHELYKKWVTTKSNLLWITGNPGCGKTVLSAFLLDQLEISTRETKVRVVYFFCDDKYDSQNTAEALLRGVIHQLLSANLHLIKHAMPKYHSEGSRMLTSLDSLWSIFLDIATDPTIGGTYCILDALDECEEVSRKDLLGRLAKHFESTDSLGRKSYLNVILTSRPYESIQNFLHKFSIIRLRIEHEEGNINRDIADFISSEVEELAEKRGYDSELKAEVINALQRGADGMFLWVSLIIKDLEGTPTGFVAESLRTLPQDIDALYLKILSKLDKKALCGPILKVQDGIVNLVHQSAKDFLINPELKSDFRVSAIEANHKIAAICLTYLSFKEFEEGPLNAVYDFQAKAALSSRLRKFKFLGYSGKHWPEHVRQVASADLWENFSKLAQNPLKLELAYQTFCFLGNKNFKIRELHLILVHFNIPLFLKIFLEGGADVNIQEGENGSALQLAAKEGNEIVVNLLLDKGADINTQGGECGNALQAAAAVWRGNDTMVKLLLEKGANANMADMA